MIFKQNGANKGKRNGLVFTGGKRKKVGVRRRLPLFEGFLFFLFFGGFFLVFDFSS